MLRFALEKWFLRRQNFRANVNEVTEEYFLDCVILAVMPTEERGGQLECGGNLQTKSWLVVGFRSAGVGLKFTAERPLVARRFVLSVEIETRQFDLTVATLP